MSLRKKKKSESGPQVPAYIVTFSDMVTLLLTFFVLLLSMAEDDNPDKFKIGQESFKRSLANFGLRGILYTVGSTNEFVDKRVNHPIDEQDPEEQLVPVNAREEQLRRLFSKINDQMNVRPSQIKGKLTDLITPQIKFARGSSMLNEKQQSYLSELASEISLSAGSTNMTIYVVGLAPAENGKDKWVISAQRAKCVSQYLENKLGDNFLIYSWGTADASEWVTSAGSKSIESDIIIVILQ